ncbi:MAG: helix-turn-helix domain-containing protein, partial [Solirubrobacteraceae bacterium]
PAAWRAIVDLAPALLEPRAGAVPAKPARRLNARVVHLPRGELEIEAIEPDPARSIGLLVLDGLLLAHLDAGRAHSGWLVGADDLIRPWDLDQISLARPTGWRVLTPARVALLDGDFSIRAGGLPAVARALVASAARTTSWLLATALVMASPAVEERLLLAFALFGERWGIVNHRGVLLRLPLTHELLATLCGARRPSVTVALGVLARKGVLTRTPEGHWLLHRQHIDERARQPSCWRQYTGALGLTS